MRAHPSNATLSRSDYTFTLICPMLENQCVRGSSGSRIKNLRVLPHETAVRRSHGIMDVSDMIEDKAVPAKDAPIEKTKSGEIFRRFSAYENDVRRRPDGSWTPGTYATTEEDAKSVKTGKAAAARYALPPNPTPVSYVFTGRPHKDTEVQKGPVAPAYGQPGGGVEVIFTNGTRQNTVTGPIKIPEE